MSEARCPLKWKASALEDGRLGGADRLSFERHASTCTECRAETMALAALNAMMREASAYPVAPLERARQRASLLARANERFVGPPRSGRVRWAAVAVAVMALGVGGIVVRRSAPPVVAEADTAVSTPHYAIVEDPHAIWRTHSNGSTGRVELADGAAVFSVDPLAPAQRFVVTLPDGELEVRGTRFGVSVALGHTTGVNALEGTVVFHRRDTPELVLHAGETWAPPRIAEVASAAPPIASASSSVRAPVAGASPPAPARVDPNVAKEVAPAATPSAVPRPNAISPTSRIAGERFDEAVSSFVRGSYAQADTLLVDFVRRFPEDTRCEDAAFLGAVARWRLGDAPGARARAEAYLSTYPQGLRRAEAQRIVDDAR